MQVLVCTTWKKAAVSRWRWHGDSNSAKSIICVMFIKKVIRVDKQLTAKHTTLAAVPWSGEKCSPQQYSFITCVIYTLAPQFTRQRHKKPISSKNTGHVQAPIGERVPYYKTQYLLSNLGYCVLCIKIFFYQHPQMGIID